MKKLLTWLIVISFIILPVSSFAAGEPLSDSQMDEIAAGDWVVISSDEEVVEGVHFSNNDINLETESQMEIQAVNNVNSVDSADAVQTNIANATEGLIDVNGRNEATLANYNPSSEMNSSFETSLTDTSSMGMAKSSSFNLDKIKTCAFGASASKTDTDLSLETLDIIATLTMLGESESKSDESDFSLAGALNVDYDNQTNKSKSFASSISQSGSETLNIDSMENCNMNATATKIATTKITNNCRSNKSENNHIDLEDTSQKNLQVVSNLNSVGSAAAVQTNIANATGISGAVTHVNIASASNGM